MTEIKYSIILFLTLFGNIYPLTSGNPDFDVTAQFSIYEFEEPLPETSGESLTVRVGHGCVIYKDGTTNCHADMCDVERNQEPVCEKRRPFDYKPVCQCRCPDIPNIKDDCDDAIMVHHATKAHIHINGLVTHFSVDGDIFVTSGTVVSDEPGVENKMIGHPGPTPTIGLERGPDGMLVLDLGFGAEVCQPVIGQDLRVWTSFVMDSQVKIPDQILNSIIRSMTAQDLAKILNEQVIEQIFKIAKNVN